MKRLLLVLFALSALTAQCQLGWEDFFSEDHFRNVYQQAKNPKEKILALGLLAKKGLPKDSITKEIYAVANKTNKKELKAMALWWDAKLHGNDTTRMIKLSQFAEQNQLLTYKIAAELMLADFYLYKSVQRSLSYGLTADSLVRKMKGGTKETDSLTIEICHRIAHAYIHNEDAINTAKYLLPLWNYAKRNSDESTRIHAVDVLSSMYREDDLKKSIRWGKILYDYFKKTDQPQKLLSVIADLGGRYASLYMEDSIPEHKSQSIYYFKQFDRLQDSLKAHGEFLYWVIYFKMYTGMLSGDEAIRLIDNNYNGYHRFSPDEISELKIEAYWRSKQFDSLKAYIDRIPNTGYRDPWMINYYLAKEDYAKAVPILRKSLNNTEPGNFPRLKWLYDELVKVYVGIKDYQLAYEYKLKSLSIKDSLEKQKSKEEIASMEMQKQIELQQAAFDDEQSKISIRNKTRLYIFAAGLTTLLFVSVILWRNNQRKQRDKIKIEQAYQELKSTQQQLVQSEKMASLGELTAGIAHEIQNPLNFVNNFSEINTELVTELQQEAASGNLDEVKAIAKSIRENEEKIIHHGKRADAIVKGMLQHSRASSGQKEPTDINALADEYLRLAYHGFRAKEKSFSATMETEFDNSIENIKVVPQEIGRVILNLINNAFYAVNEKQKQSLNGYEPVITVTTKKLTADKVEVRVKDNGMGIPQKVQEKIFQPFFTTKPTGQGTGLGLSLSYDIMKSHGGEIKVNTKEGEGSEFIIQLGVN
jgi:signal transduction histidine kinase